VRVSSDMCVWRCIACMPRRYRHSGRCVDLGRGHCVAQPGPVFSLDPLNAGDCRVVVTIANPKGGDQVGVIADQTLMREQTVV
jgi:hypothetical protein